MKILLYIVIGIVLVMGLLFAALSLSSRKQPDLGLVNGQLRACPDTPNCVNSEQQDNNVFIEPYVYTVSNEDAWSKIKQVMLDTGGTIVSEEASYLHATYQTPIMRYIDDVELRLDSQNQRIHIRSASRVGHSDMGANRKRVEQIRRRF